MTATDYSKPFRSVTEQIEILRSRGMLIADDDLAAQALETIGYYRLSGYWYPFRELVAPTQPADSSRRADTFEPGTRLDTVIGLYEFDRRLKLIVLDAVERVEVCMRFWVGHILGRDDAFAHCDPAALRPGFTDITDPTSHAQRARWLDSDHAAWLRKARQNQSRSKEDFVRHFNEIYHGDLPVWVITEVLDFGGLSMLYAAMTIADSALIAEQFGLLTATGLGDGPTLTSWMRNLNYIRNVCAHHSRLWNKNVNVQAARITGVPELSHANIPTPRVYTSLTILAYLTTRIDGHTEWAQTVRGHVETLSTTVGQDETAMGFPLGWRAEPIWQPGYRNDSPLTRAQRELRRTFDFLTPAAAGMLLDPTSPKHAGTAVKNARKSGALLAMKFEGAAWEYPAFQFDQANGGIRPQAEAANLRLNADHDAWQLARWWCTPLTDGRTPRDLLATGDLTDQIVDDEITSPGRDDSTPVAAAPLAPGEASTADGAINEMPPVP